MKKILLKILLFLFPSLNNDSDAVTNKGNKIATNNYVLKSLMTPYENRFYSILKELEVESNIKVHPQVNLATIIDKVDSKSYRSELFRNIDFGIFTSDYGKLLLLIEINDNTHNFKKRKSRDQKVDIICKNANIRLIKFYTNYPNEKEYVKNRVLKEIMENSRVI